MLIFLFFRLVLLHSALHQCDIRMRKPLTHTESGVSLFSRSALLCGLRELLPELQRESCLLPLHQPKNNRLNKIFCFLSAKMTAHRERSVEAVFFLLYYQNIVKDSFDVLELLYLRISNQVSPYNYHLKLTKCVHILKRIIIGYYHISALAFFNGTC